MSNRIDGLALPPGYTTRPSLSDDQLAQAPNAQAQLIDKVIRYMVTVAGGPSASVRSTVKVAPDGSVTFNDSDPLTYDLVLSKLSAFAGDSYFKPEEQKALSALVTDMSAYRSARQASGAGLAAGDIPPLSPRARATWQEQPRITATVGFTYGQKTPAERGVQGVDASLKWPTPYGQPVVGYGHRELNVNNYNYPGSIVSTEGPKTLVWTEASEDSYTLGYGVDTRFAPAGSSLKPEGFDLRAGIGVQHTRQDTDLPPTLFGGKRVRSTVIKGTAGATLSQWPLAGAAADVDVTQFNLDMKQGFRMTGVPNYSLDTQMSSTLVKGALQLPITKNWDLLTSLAYKHVGKCFLYSGQNVYPDWCAEGTSWKPGLGGRVYLPWGTLEAGLHLPIGTGAGAVSSLPIDSLSSVGGFVGWKVFRGNDPPQDVTWRVEVDNLATKYGFRDLSFRNNPALRLAGGKERREGLTIKPSLKIPPFTFSGEYAWQIDEAVTSSRTVSSLNSRPPDGNYYDTTTWGIGIGYDFNPYMTLNFNYSHTAAEAQQYLNPVENFREDQFRIGFTYRW